MPRDPYPFPKYENDGDFTGVKATQVGIRHRPKAGTTFLGAFSGERPWDRLHQTQTLSSQRRTVHHYDPQEPRDDLDFVVKSQYNHHKEFLKSKAETLFQPETIGMYHGRKLKNKPPSPPPVIQQEDIVMKKSISKKNENINSINGAIASHHSAATNGGYSRKHDGGFYTC